MVAAHVVPVADIVKDTGPLPVAEYVQVNVVAAPPLAQPTSATMDRISRDARISEVRLARIERPP